MARLRDSCKSYTFTDAQDDSLVLSETAGRDAILVTIRSAISGNCESVLLDASQFEELCRLDGYDYLEVHEIPAPEPEPVQADPAPVEG